MYDLQSSSGQNDYCDEVKTKRIIKATLEGGYFKHPLDRMRHNSIQARKFDHCQYCYYNLMNKILESVWKYYKDLKQNRSGCHAHGNNFHGYGGRVLKIWYLKPTKIHIVKVI